MTISAVKRRAPGRVRVVDLPSPDRRIVVVGGGPQAAWLVADLSRSAHPILVVAPRICDDLVDMLHEHRFQWLMRDPSARDLEGAWLVHAATGDDVRDADVCRWVDVTSRRARLATAG